MIVSSERVPDKLYRKVDGKYREATSEEVNAYVISTCNRGCFGCCYEAGDFGDDVRRFWVPVIDGKESTEDQGSTPYWSCGCHCHDNPPDDSTWKVR